MKRLGIAAAAAIVAAHGAHAGGVERSTQSVAPIFEEGGANGNYVEFSFTSVNPKISGTSVAGLGSAPSGDMAPSYATFGTAFKMPLTQDIDAALIFDQPYGADVAYPTGTGYFAAGSTAELRSNALTGIVKYSFNERVSAFVGVRAQTFEAMAMIPFVSSYSGSTETDIGVGGLVGVAYENKANFQRVSLTYNSKIKHNLATTESFGAGPATTSTTEIETPQSINLEAQTGLPIGLLLRGSVRWVNWSDFDITPAAYFGATGAPLVSYADDTITYELGVIRPLNDTWSVGANVSHEKQNGGFSSNLGPTDGRTSVGLGAIYRKDNMRIIAGVSHTWIGDAQTAITGFAPASNFTDNSATAFRMSVGFNF